MSERYRRTIGKRRERICIDCSEPFLTYAPNKVRCNACQRMYELRVKKKRERLRRRSSKGLYQILGTEDKTTYLTTLLNGRIYGVVWLEKQMKKLDGRKVRYKCPVCSGEDDMLLIINHEPYCIECGGKVVYATENEYYSAGEFACSHCGLVVES